MTIPQWPEDDEFERRVLLHCTKAVQFVDRPERLGVLVQGMVSFGTIGEVLVRLGHVLHHTSRDAGQAVLQPHLDVVDRSVRDLALRHGAAIVDAVALLHRELDAPVTLGRLTQAAVDELGPQLAQLVGLLAHAAGPVVGSCGGFEHIHRVGLLVEQAERQGRVVAIEAAGPVGLALAALSSGHDEAAADYFAVPPDPTAVLVALLGIASVLLPDGGDVAAILELDQHGVPTAVSNEPVAAITHDLLGALITHDQARIDAQLATLAALSPIDRIGVAMIVARTLADQINRQHQPRAPR